MSWDCVWLGDGLAEAGKRAVALRLDWAKPPGIVQVKESCAPVPAASMSMDGVEVLTPSPSHATAKSDAWTAVTDPETRSEWTHLPPAHLTATLSVPAPPSSARSLRTRGSHTAA